MDQQLEVERQRKNLNLVIAEITSVIKHAEDSYQQLQRLIKVHKDSPCIRDCFDCFPNPPICLNAKLELVYLVQEFTARSATGTIPPGRLPDLLSKASTKLEEAHELFESLHNLCLEYMKRSRTRRCKARPAIVKEFQI